MTVHRWTGVAKGRSRSCAYGGVVWTVANAFDASAGFETQVTETFAMLEAHLIA